MPTHLANPGGVLAAIPWLDFARPGWLLLLPILLALTIWIARNALGGWHGGRQTVFLLIRCTVITLLCIALAEPSIERRATDVAVVVVRDMSRSVPPDQQRAADVFVSASLARKQESDRLGVVTAAREAIVQSLPAPSQQLPESTYVGETDATNKGRSRWPAPPSPLTRAAASSSLPTATRPMATSPPPSARRARRGSPSTSPPSSTTART